MNNKQYLKKNCLVNNRFVFKSRTSSSERYIVMAKDIRISLLQPKRGLKNDINIGQCNYRE